MGRAYTVQLRTLVELKQSIQDEIRGEPSDILHQAMVNLNGRLTECIF